MLKLKIVTPERTVLDEDVDEVYARSVEGEFGVKPKHIPLVAPLQPGVLTYLKNGQRHPAAVMGGVFQTDGHKVTVLTNSAELAGEVDLVRAEEAKKRAESRLKEKNAEVDTKRAEMALGRALVRLKLR